MDYRNTMPASNYQQQKLRVCEVCSAFLGIHDNDRRLADHFGGKLHVGFITLRSKLANLQVFVVCFSCGFVYILFCVFDVVRYLTVMLIVHVPTRCACSVDAVVLT